MPVKRAVLWKGMEPRYVPASPVAKGWLPLLVPCHRGFVRLVSPSGFVVPGKQQAAMKQHTLGLREMKP